MKNIVFVAPFFLDATTRFVNAVASLPDVRIGLISQDPTEKLSPSLRAKIAGHYRVDDAMSVENLTTAVRAMQKHFGHVHRLLGTLEQIQEQLAVVRDRLEIEGMRAEAARNFRDKARMKEVLRAAGLPCARHALCASADDVRAFVNVVGYPIVIKPLQGAAAVATYRVASAEALEKAIALLSPGPGRPAVAEEFVLGEERSLETVTIGGRPVWHSGTRYAPTPLTVMENPWIQWTVLLPREQINADVQMSMTPGREALTALGMHTGFSHMEWFKRVDGSIAISEIAARPPGAQIMTLNGFAHSADFYALFANLMVNDAWSVGERNFAAGVAFFRGQGAGSKIRALRGVEQAQKEVGQWVVESKLPRVGQSKSSGYEGEGYAIVRHPETEVVEFALKRLVSLIHVEVG